MIKLLQCYVSLAVLLVISTCTFGQNEFITEWEVSGTTLQFPGIGNNYTISWENINDATQKGTIDNAQNGETITFSAAGTYRIKVSNGSGNFTGFNSNSYAKDAGSLQKVTHWGNIKWTSLKQAFANCKNMDVTATDVPDLSKVTELSHMFLNCSKLAGTASFGNWNTKTITNMEGMFAVARSFNQPIGTWNTQNVTNMKNMFRLASDFNQSLANWNLSGAPDLTDMLEDCGMGCEIYSATLAGWNNNSQTPDNLQLGAIGLSYNRTAQAAHTNLINTKKWTITGDRYDAACGSLPVGFGSLSASISGNDLMVNWNTVSEQNNKEFIIEISKDGINNWEKVATVKSNAVNGNSNSGLDYSKTIPLGNALAIAAILLLLPGSLPSGRNRIVMLIMAFLLGAGAYSCSKKDTLKTNKKTGKVFVRLSQTDKDGSIKVLDTKEAVRK